MNKMPDKETMKIIRLERKAMELTMQYGDPDHPEVLKARKALAEAKAKKA